MLRILIEVLIGIIVFLLIVCLLLTKPRKCYCDLVMSSIRALRKIITDEVPTKKKGIIKSLPLFLLAVIYVLLGSVITAVFLLVAYPAVCVISSINLPEKTRKHEKTPEQIAEEDRIWHEMWQATHFTVARKDLPFEPVITEILFYTPESDSAIENAIAANYEAVNDAFKKRGYRFVFLPRFSNENEDLQNTDLVNYYNPRATNLPSIPKRALTYQDIKESLKLPDKANVPCFIRCQMEYDTPLVFSFFKIEPTERSIVSVVEEYLSQVGNRRLFALHHDKSVWTEREGLPADNRFDYDVYLIGKEIRERIEQLRSKGLSTLAIRKLIGDESDKPGKLLINKQNKLILTDFGNKEIKLEPLHKAVFFLFLRHPEGIYFKDLCDYREELGTIYREITGREDLSGIQDSIDKLTNPLNNSINEKCARIKNAFVSEFREEVAQWYFIDGERGEKKSIKLPRELVTWEIKD